MAEPLVEITGEERDLILASLRLFQKVSDGPGISPAIWDIASNGATHDVPDQFAIDDLCERLNV